MEGWEAEEDGEAEDRGAGMWGLCHGIADTIDLRLSCACRSIVVYWHDRCDVAALQGHHGMGGEGLGRYQRQ